MLRRRTQGKSTTNHHPRRTPTNKPHQVDYKKLAALSGMTNPASASNAWARIKKKLAAQAALNDGGDTHNPKSVKSTPSKRSKKDASPNGDGDDDEHSPAKVCILSRATIHLQFLTRI
jgi:hypothetical protein